MTYKQIEFNIGERKFHYSFDELNLLQTELAHAAGLFKHDLAQAQILPESFSKVGKAGVADWLITVVRYLIKEKIEDALVPFERGKAEADFHKVLANAPIIYEEKKNFKDLCLEIVEDFFHNTGFSKNFLNLLTEGNKKNQIQLYLDLLKEMNAFRTAISKKTKSEDQESMNPVN